MTSHNPRFGTGPAEGKDATSITVNCTDNGTFTLTRVW